MNWLNPTGSGSIANAGLTNSWYPKYSSAVMYDQGKILVAGGAADSSNTAPGSNKAMVIDLNGANTTKSEIAPMTNARKFNNTVVLPTGEVMVIGGNTSGTEFSDSGTILTPEIWNPDTQTWRAVANHTIPRNYHSVALLMTDGRVWSGGGGLCNCAADHPNHEIYSPPYLFNADGSLASRPVISNAPGSITYGNTFNVQVTPGVEKFSLIKLSGITHNLNSDLRHLRVPFTTPASGQYQLTVSNNPNILTPGYWMLFAVDSQGVPSVAKVIQVVSSTAPSIVNPGPQNTLVNSAVNLPINASSPVNAALIYSAAGLPAGLTINSTSGLISGAPTTASASTVTVSVSDGQGGTANQSFPWTVVTPPPAGTVRYVKLEVLSEVNGNPWTSAAEFNLLDGNGSPLNRSGWTITADSQETQGENGVASNVADNNAATIWHTQWQAANPAHPHWLVINLGNTYAVSAFRYLPRQDGINGRIANYRFFVSADGMNWNSPVAQGTFPNTATEQTVTVTTNRPPVVTNPGNQTSAAGQNVNLLISASDPDGDLLTFSATGLPAGLTIDSGTGIIAGAPISAGAANVTVSVADGRGGASSQGFTWITSSDALMINTITSAPKPVNTVINYIAGVTNGVNPRFKWLFGDGTPETAYSTAPSMEHTFILPGIYVVKATAIDDRNVEQSTTFVQAIHLPQTTNRPVASMDIVYETRASASGRVWVVNQDNDTVSVFDAVTNSKTAEITVGIAPRSLAIAPDGRVWVTNKGSASLSIIDPGTLTVAQTVTLPIGSQPFGIAFASTGDLGYVALEGTGELLRLDARSAAQTGSIAVGLNVRHLSIPSDGSRIYVSRFITPRLPGEDTATPQMANVGGEIVVVSAADLSVNKTILLRASDKPDTEVQGRGIPNYLGPVVISPDGVNGWTPSKQDNIQRGTLRDGQNLNFQNTVRAISSHINLTTDTEDYGTRLDHDNAGVASAALFDRSGSYFFVALETSREVAVVDAYRPTELFRIPVGRAPQGMALSPDGLRLYVHNFMDRTVTVVNVSKVVNEGKTTAPVLATYNSIATEKLPANVLAGKQLFYDAKDTRLALDGYVSCAACHNDGGQDGRIWDLTGFGEGLRNTISLRGRAGMGQGFLHWSGNFDEVQDFEGQIRALAGGAGLMTDAQFNTGTRNQPLGDPKAGVSADLDALAAYVTSLSSFASSPHRNADGTLTAAGSAGRTVFKNANCAQCHNGVAFTDSGADRLHNIGTIKPTSGGRLGGALLGIDTPTLRDSWATGPYLHDGSAANLADAMAAHTGTSLSPNDLASLVAYLQQIDASEPEPFNPPPTVNLTTPTNGAVFEPGIAINLTADAADNSGAVAKVEFFAGAALLSTDTAPPFTFVWNNAPAGNHTLTAKAYDSLGASSTSAPVNVMVNAATACTLPSGWSTLDIGSPGQAGSGCENTGTWTVKGGGTDIWGRSDKFRFAYRDANGSYTIITRVTSVQNTNSWAKAGVMFRDGTAANAKFVMVEQMPNNEVAMQWRSNTGGSTSWNGTRLGGTSSVKWVKLVRSGNSFTGYYATTITTPANNQWIQIGSPRTISMNTSAKVGLAVTAHNDSLLSTATFTGVNVTTP